METEMKELRNPILKTLSESLLQLQQEIDELALQLSLGKSDARDKFEEIKNEFKSKLTGLKLLLNTAIDRAIPVDLDLKMKELDLQLQSNKAISIETFEAQRTALITATVALEEELVKVLKKVEVSDYFHHEVEKFMLKLEIVRLKFGIKRFEIKDAFHARMTSAKKAIEKISTKAKKIEGRARSGKHELTEDITTAYKHLKNAVKNL